MVVGVCHVNRAVVVGDSNGVLQADVVIGSVDISELEKTQAYDSAQPAVGRKIGGPHGAGFAVGEIKSVAIGRYAAGLGQGGDTQRAVI